MWLFSVLADNFSSNDRRPKSSQLVKLECIDDGTLFSYFKIRI